MGTPNASADPKTKEPVVTPDPKPSQPTADPKPPDPEPDPEPVMSTAQLKARLDQQRDRTKKQVLTLLGLPEDTEQAQEALAQLRAIQDAQLSADERKDNLIKELEPVAAKAKQLKSLVGKIADEKFNALSEKAREAIDDVADGDPERRLELISVLEAADMSKQPPKTGEPAAGKPPTDPKGTGDPKPPPANTAPPGGAPRSSGAHNRYEEYKSITNETQAEVFYQIHQREIERDRPAE
jgi:hypothetical protein